ncbi:MAG: DUF2024 family protein [Saprospiraceae bacterium]|nr:DUF2024 family protein [Saprospiraceae bacterium]
MQVAVYDTYVLMSNGATAHFDILAPQNTAPEQVLEFGKKYLAERQILGQLSSQECQFCHVETLTPEVAAELERQGYYILEMDDIPAQLPEQPSRRALIEHLRARSPEHRFADFRGVEENQLWQMIRGLDGG